MDERHDKALRGTRPPAVSAARRWAARSCAERGCRPAGFAPTALSTPTRPGAAFRVLGICFRAQDQGLRE